MVQQIIMSDESLKDILDGCRNTAFDLVDLYGDNSELDNYLLEIKNHQDWTIVWTKIFKIAYGEPIEWDSLSVYVDGDVTL